VDAAFAPLYPAITWLDLRASAQAERISRECPTLYEVTGKPPTAPYTLPKLLWLQENAPEIWAAARYFLMPMDYLQAKLTGKVATDHSMACGTALYDLKNGTWCEKIARQFAIPLEKLPPIVARLRSMSPLWEG
jgi:xylulokinase